MEGECVLILFSFWAEKIRKGKDKVEKRLKVLFFSWKGKRSELISSDFIHLKTSVECLSADKMKHRITEMSHMASPIGVWRFRRHNIVVLQRGNERNPEWIGCSPATR